MEIKEQVIGLAVKHFDVPGFVGGVIGGPVDQALQKLVDDTSTPFDNIAKAAVYPALVEAINQAVKAEWAKLAPVQA